MVYVLLNPCFCMSTRALKLVYNVTETFQVSTQSARNSSKKMKLGNKPMLALANGANDTSMYSEHSREIDSDLLPSI